MHTLYLTETRDLVSLHAADPDSELYWRGKPEESSVASWRTVRREAKLIVADSPYFSSKASAILDLEVPVIGIGFNLRGLFSQQGQVFFDAGIPTEFEHPKVASVTAFFNGSDWTWAQKGKSKAFKTVLEPLAEVLSRIGYRGPFSVDYTRRFFRHYAVRISPTFGYHEVVNMVIEDKTTPRDLFTKFFLE